MNVFDVLREKFNERHTFYENRFAEMGGTDRDVEDLGSIKSYADAIDIVNQVEQEYNNGWITCSERLPEEDEKVIVSTKTGVVNVGLYTKRYGFSMREGFICDDGFMWLNTATAWQPLPPKYEPKGE